MALATRQGRLHKLWTQIANHGGHNSRARIIHARGDRGEIRWRLVWDRSAQLRARVISCAFGMDESSRLKLREGA